MKKFSWLIDFLADFLIIAGITLLVTQYVVSLGTVNGRSMETTLTEGQKVVLDKASMNFTNPKRFDIVAVKFPGEENYWVKRVIGLPGETVEFKENQLYIDGQPMAQDFLPSDVITDDYSTFQALSRTNGVIPEGEYLIMGDNRSNSFDGRMKGTIKKEDILGIGRFSIYPFDRFGTL